MAVVVSVHGKGFDRFSEKALDRGLYNFTNYQVQSMYKITMLPIQHLMLKLNSMDILTDIQLLTGRQVNIHKQHLGGI